MSADSSVNLVTAREFDIIRSLSRLVEGSLRNPSEATCRCISVVERLGGTHVSCQSVRKGGLGLTNSGKCFFHVNGKKRH